MTHSTEVLPDSLTRRQKPALVAGVICLIATVVLWFATDTMVQAYLWAYVFWVAFPLGCLGALLLHHLVVGAWGFCIQRILEAGARTFWIIGLLFLPILFGVYKLYPWTDIAERTALPELVSRKEAVLNVPMYVACTVVVFLIWALYGRLLSHWSDKLDKTADQRYIKWMRMVSAPGLVVFFLTVTVAAFFWGMTLEPEWFSTIYGPIYVVGQGLTVWSLGILLYALMRRREPHRSIHNVEYFHHLGNLLLGFTVLWAYVNFAQYLIIWSGNLPEEVVFYTSRTATSWQVIALFLMAFHFAVPFFVLLSRHNKRIVRNLARVAFYVLLMRLVDLFWLIMPAFYPGGLSDLPLMLILTIPVAWVAIGGIWYYFFINELKSRPLLPLNNPWMGEAFAKAHDHAQEAEVHGTA